MSNAKPAQLSNFSSIILALYLTILGGVIAQYEGEDSWQDEVLEGWATLSPSSIVYLYAFVTELDQDRVGVISDEGKGEGTVAAVVDSSLRMVNEFTQEVLMSLGVCPEDVRSPPLFKCLNCVL